MISQSSSAPRLKTVPYALPPDALEGLLRLAAHVALTETASLFLQQGEHVWPLAAAGVEADAGRAAALLLPDALDTIDTELIVPDASLEREPMALLASVLCGEPGLLILHRFPVQEPGCQAVLVLAHPVSRSHVSEEVIMLLSEISRQIALRMEARVEKKQLEIAREGHTSLQQHLEVLANPRCIGHCLVNEKGHLLSISEALLAGMNLTADAVEGFTFENLFAFDSTFQDEHEDAEYGKIPWNRVQHVACVHRASNGNLVSFTASAAPIPARNQAPTWNVAILRAEEGTGMTMVPGRRKQTILIAEDHPVNQRVIQGMVEKLGMRAEIVSNGLEAVHAVCHNDYAAILMDCQMPEMDGIEATRFIRGNEESIGHIPIVAVTAFGQEDDRIRCLEAGVDEFMVKPIRMEALAAVLKRLTKADESSPEMPESSTTPTTRRVEEALDRLRADLDADIVRDIVTLFLEDSSARMVELRSQAEQQQWQKARDLIHKIKGSCSSLGARDLMEACEAFEAERSSNPETLRQRIANIDNCFQETAPHLRWYIDNL